MGPGVAHLRLFGRLGREAKARRERTWWGELVAAVGLTFSGLMALTVAGGGWEPLAWWVWLATIL